MNDFVKKKSIKHKLFRAFLLSVVVPLTIICLVAGFRIGAVSRQNYYTNAEKITQQVDNGMSTFIDEARLNVNMLAIAGSVRQAANGLTRYRNAAEAAAPPSAIEQQNLGLFRILKQAHDNYDEVFMGTADSGFAAYPKVDLSAGYDPTGRPWYKDAIAQPDQPILTAAYQSATGAPVASVVKTVKDQAGTTIGVVGLDLKLDRLTEIISAMKFGKTGYLIVLQSDGTILADPAQPEMAFKTVNDYKQEDFKQFASMKSGEHATISIDGNDYLASVYESPTLGWKYISLIQENEVLGATYTLVAMIAFIGLILGAIFVAIAFVLANKIANPLTQATRVLEDIAQGGGDLTMRLKIDSNDEIGELAHWFNQFVGKLEDIIRSVKQTAVQVDQATQEVAAGSQGLSQATQEQASAVEEVAATIEEMTSSIKQNAENAEHGRQQTRDMVSLAAETGELASRVVSAMQEINTSSQKIGDIIGTVNEVAFQTNLLALNAAVEAARAGEHGKGFAVVASEVRALAQRSADSAREVRTLIEDSLSKVKNGNVMVEEAGKSIGTIVERIENVSGTMEEIAAASSEQATGIDELNRAVSQIDASTQNNATTVEELAGASESLRQDSRTLAETVVRFKVSGYSEAATSFKSDRKTSRPAAPTPKATMKPAETSPSVPPASRPPVMHSNEDDFEEF